jgi:phage shock protein A
MSLFQRAHDILAAKTNKALDAAEKPDEMLDLSYEQMLDQITKVRQALVTIAASPARLPPSPRSTGWNRSTSS